MSSKLMTFNPQSNIKNPNQIAGSPSGTRGSNSYCPSVPISVYRELAAELQVTQAQLEALKAENQQLTKQNQQLCSEVGKVLQSAQNLKRVVNSLDYEQGDTSFSHPVM
ncbi:MAG: DUF3450 domain-containing protein, partial [Okeania sp. SIO2D1]|nr:DUF3450 domain-containing protein [Okeania sp. SIO2D1]